MVNSSKYLKATFKSRPNRFIAEVEIDGEIVIAHVPNTGRCKELLIEGATVYLMPSDNPKRKTKFSLLFVENNGALVSIYSQEANKIVYEGILNGKIKELNGYSIIKREKTVGNSRMDIYLDNPEENKDCYIEVKGVTLVEDNVAIFPDAPTERGKKHLDELIELKKKGHRSVAFFLIQHPNGNSFRPNWQTDIDFSETLTMAEKAGVEILVYKSKNSLNGNEIIGKAMEYNLEKY
ncbi:DNA/RNA nuclease SfsA [Methanobrevibacter sp. TMH8]|uniref:DNA/RNA nuclease SfsA n=1 Tax=Methanobrevibacter sp. TMH8 TaxID=2848611 RepID=UPI001CCEC6B9|nr:DNA/RNA nuclease SfsA [Methanobrevibacter sp. TMH8]MBZ9570137.1 DNA/RNA nuclease SfsA [Methanobrevibacter sp. TMH8]